VSPLAPLRLFNRFLLHGLWIFIRRVTHYPAPVTPPKVIDPPATVLSCALLPGLFLLKCWVPLSPFPTDGPLFLFLGPVPVSSACAVLYKDPGRCPLDCSYSMSLTALPPRSAIVLVLFPAVSPLMVPPVVPSILLGQARKIAILTSIENFGRSTALPLNLSWSNDNTSPFLISLPPESPLLFA